MNNVSIRGLNELQGFLLTLAPKTKQAVRIATEASIRTMQADAVSRAPV